MGTRTARAAQAHGGAEPVMGSYGVALRARMAQRNLDDLGEWIAAVIPGLDELAAREVVETVALGRKGLSMLHRHLSTHPDGLVSGDSDCPIVFLRLMRALVEAGHPVTPLRCVDCDRSGLTLNCRIAGGRLCGTCANRHRAQPCSRCGAVATVHARQSGQPVCLPCYEKDPANAKHCTRCGKAGHIAVRTPDGGRVCRRCYQPPRQQCIHCGQAKLINTRAVSEPPLRADARRNRARILAAAAEVFDEHGTSASTEEVARRAAVAIGTVFRHFPTKDDLLAAIMKDLQNRLATEAEALAAKDEPTALFTFFADIVEHAASTRTVIHLLAAAGTNVGVDRQLAALGEALDTPLARAQKAHTVRDEVQLDEVNRINCI